jgi:hypothetical protein
MTERRSATRACRRSGATAEPALVRGSKTAASAEDRRGRRAVAAPRQSRLFRTVSRTSRPSVLGHGGVSNQTDVVEHTSCAVAASLPGRGRIRAARRRVPASPRTPREFAGEVRDPLIIPFCMDALCEARTSDHNASTENAEAVLAEFRLGVCTGCSCRTSSKSKARDTPCCPASTRAGATASARHGARNGSRQVPRHTQNKARNRRKRQAAPETGRCRAGELCYGSRFPSCRASGEPTGGRARRGD